ncbi:MAG: diguanylate cyclase [Mesorhizobium sp.]|uniref:GGDEF domain-containing protein n=1 Tax=Mesorhizobium sp. TaxID=1871066 RepID=UPI000FE5BDA8|nr:MAG: diguanylate cyclase [Mesorhizobium sp.]
MTCPGDSVGRLGGEEFGVLLRGVHKEQATTIAHNIRLIEGIPWTKWQQSDLQVTVSICGAEISPNADFQDILRTAGRCLAEAKQRGRNCVAFDYEVSRLPAAVK